MNIHLAAASAAPGNPLLNISIFGAFVAITLIIVVRASRNNKTAADYYAAGRSFTGGQNGTAIAGDYLSAASFLGIVGAIAITPASSIAASNALVILFMLISPRRQPCAVTRVLRASDPKKAASRERGR